MTNEIKKNGKIIDELVTYFLKKGHHQLRMDINYTKSQTIITIWLDHVAADELALIRECLSQGRDFAMEEYGWELMGESEVSAELNLVGMCIDEVEFDHVDDTIVAIKLIRRHL